MLEVVEVSKSYDRVRALHGISMHVSQAEIVAVLGPSGCGKSTLLLVVAGLEPPDQGDVRWDGQSLAGIPPHQRDFGLMFQDFALFPHMNVAGNVAFGLRMARMDEAGIKARTAEMLDLVSLADYGHRDTSTLSGGEAQRVALARTLAPSPRLLMLDEPLGSLDRTLRERLLADLRTILRGLKKPAIVVTHDQEEAFSLADRVVLMDAGRAVQTGTPQEIYQRPNSPFVARFLGLRNLLPGEARPEAGRVTVRTEVGEFPADGVAPGPVTVLIRPDEANLDGKGEIHLRGLVREHSFRGDRSRLLVEIDATRLTFDFPSNQGLPAPGEPISLSLHAEQGILVWPGVPASRELEDRPGTGAG